MKKYFVIFMLVFFPYLLMGQNHRTEEEEVAYTEVINERAQKIVVKLELDNPEKALKLRDVIAQQYRSLSDTHDAKDEKLKEAKKIEDKTASKALMANIENETKIALFQLNRTFVAQLNALLTSDQVSQVKDGMTYGVVPNTYKNYLEMLPGLTETQKHQIYANLIEAREYAMDAGSSKEKHQWFGKYKGRINNYLSSQGYDLKKAGEEWQERLQAAKE